MSIVPHILKPDLEHSSTSTTHNLTDEFRKTKQQADTASSLDFKHRDGRRWHGSDQDAYVLPNDEIEGERLDRQHLMLKKLLEGSLSLVPLAEKKTILDLGTGTGIWAIECAEENPNSQVIGVDFSAIQPSDPPQNCKFLTGDLEKEWEFLSAIKDDSGQRGIDYIHARLLFLGLHDWKQFFKRCYDSLEPGGLLESLEFHLPVRICDSEPQQDLPVIKYTRLLKESGLRAGLKGFLSDAFADILNEIGFVDVERIDFQAACGPWADGAKYKEIGRLNQPGCIMAVTAMAPMIQRHSDHTKEEVDDMLQAAVSEFKTENVYLPVICHIARKPHIAGKEDTQLNG